MNEINELPSSVIQALENARIPKDSWIFHQNGHWVYQSREKISTNTMVHFLIDSLGPFDFHEIDVSFTLYPSISEYKITKIGKITLEENKQFSGIYAPIAQVTLDGSARSSANIPENATHFCWLYPPYDNNHNTETNLESTYESNFLKIGGFAYFDIDTRNNNTFQLVRVNSLFLSTNGLTFEGPFPWRQEFTEQLWNQKRFRPVTLSILQRQGAKYFAFLNPFESLLNDVTKPPWMPSLHGAFAYLFNEDHSPSPHDCYFKVAEACLGCAPSDEQ